MKHIDQGAVIKGSLVAANTALAATKTSDGKTHIFYSSKKLVNFYPGSKIGTTSSGNKVSTFYRSLNPVGDVEQKQYESGKWGASATVIKE
ncbi:hypothetical protein EYC84_007054 [Monilinia fructicola]|uniref:Uncharacterized protein n=1 Tax=Monilinia fructicola TaxID=38448 RepID=A0A5M9K844_MONFR|nr:hypothetical protein EYC84_007054 [Monilinia fructicola]